MSTLFLRIYASFVVTVVVFAGLVGLLVWVASSSWNEQRVLELADRADARGQELADALIAEDEVRAHEIAAALGEELDANVGRLLAERRSGPRSRAAARSPTSAGPGSCGPGSTSTTPGARRRC